MKTIKELMQNFGVTEAEYHIVKEHVDSWMWSVIKDRLKKGNKQVLNNGGDDMYVRAVGLHTWRGIPIPDDDTTTQTISLYKYLMNHRCEKLFKNCSFWYDSEHDMFWVIRLYKTMK